MRNPIINKRILSITIVLLTSILVTFYCQYSIFRNKYIIPDDIRQNIFWMDRFRDKELFPDDIFLKYSSWITPIGVKSIYFLTGFFADPLTVTTFLPFFECAILALYSFGLGRLLQNNATGISLAVLLSFVAWYGELIFFEDGAAGSFFPILLVAFLYYFVKKDYLKCAVVLIVQPLFYPPALLICLLTYGISFIRYKQRRLCFERNKEKIIYFLLAVIICIFIIAPRYLLESSEFGKLVTLPQMCKMPEFYPEVSHKESVEPGGRTPFFYPSLSRNLLNDRSGIEFNNSTAFLVIVCLIFTFLLRKKAFELSEEIWYFLLASCYLFVLANIAALRLFEPSRYARLSLPLFLAIFFVVNSGRWVSSIKKRLYKKIITVFLIIVFAVFYLPRIHGDTEESDDRAVDIELYDFLSTLPKDVLIAGHPGCMDSIPTLSKRKVLVMEELSLPYYPNFYNVIKKRTIDFFDVYYGTSSEEFYKFCSKYKVTHFVVYKKHFEKDYLMGKRFYLSPFNEYIIDLVRSRNRDKFILNRIPENKKLFSCKDYFIIQCDRENLFN